MSMSKEACGNTGSSIQCASSAEFYELGKNGIYRLMNVGADGIFRSQVLKGLWLQVSWLWQLPLPPLMTVLKSWKLI